MSITGQPNSEPTRSGIPTGDLGGGIMGTIGVLAALQARQTTGRGQHVDISMQDAQLSLLNYMATMYFLSGDVPTALGNSHFVHVPYGTFPANDGHIIVAVITDGFWESLMTIVDAPELNTEENKGQPGRWKNRDLINETLSTIFQSNTAEHWLTAMRGARIPCAPVNNFEQALNDPHVLARNMVVEVPHVNGTTVKQVGNPIKLSETHEDTFTAPPLVGQHTEEVLTEILGMSEEAIVQLREERVL